MNTCIRLKQAALYCFVPALLLTACNQNNITGSDLPTPGEAAARAGSITSLTATIQNGGFENWTDSTKAYYWNLSQIGAVRTTDRRSGQYAAQIWNWYYYVKGYLTNGIDIGQPQPGYDYNKTGGQPLNVRPVALTGYYKYVYGQNDGKKDSAVALIALRKYNPVTGKSEKVGYSELSLGPSSQYKQFRIPVSYVSTQVPDSLVITFISSRNGFCSGASGGNCLYLTVDDLALECGTGKDIPVQVR